MSGLTTRDARETEAVGEAVAGQLRVGDLVVLTGDLGAGKTTFVKGLARGLGVKEAVTSPTFTIVQHYAGRLPLAHVDVYRLERIQELHDLGFEELLEHNVVVVEWGEAIARVLPPDRVQVRLAMTDAGDDERKIEIVGVGPAWSTRAAGLHEALAALRSA